jgi:hypothetical protein
MPLSDARFGFRKKIERSPPIGHVGLDPTIRCTKARIDFRWGAVTPDGSGGFLSGLVPMR